MSQRYYCDHNASTSMHEEVQQCYLDALPVFGNASSLYLEGREAKEALEQARETIASSLNATADQLIFTSSGTEGNNQVLKSLIQKKATENDPIHVIISNIEHSSIRETAKELELHGIEVSRIPVTSQGLIQLEAYKNSFKPYTKLVSIIAANNEIGTIQDIQTLATIAHDNNALFHSDAVQLLGKSPIDVDALNLDFMTISSHKIHGPKGVAALYIRDDHSMTSLLSGGSHERALRAGTENIPGIIAFEKAIQLCDPIAYQKHTAPLTQALRSALESLPGIQFNGTTNGLCNTLSLSIEGVDGHGLAINCDLEGLCLSTGSACSVGSIEPSAVLSACGLSDEKNKSTVRISLGLSNHEQDIPAIAKTLITLITRMREK